MTTLLAIVICGLTVSLVIVTSRWLEARSWRRSLIGFRLTLPSGLTPDTVSTWLGLLSALTHARRGAILPKPPIAVEVVSLAQGIEHRLFVPRSMVGAVLSSLRAALPGARLDELDARAADNALPLALHRHTVAAEVLLAGRLRQLAIERSEAASQSLLAALQPLQSGECVIWQWIITGATTPAPLPAPHATGDTPVLPWWLEANAPADADELRAARLKQREPLLHVSGRLLVQATTAARAQALFGRTWGPIRLLNVPGARLVRALWPSDWVSHRLQQRRLPLVVWPLRLNAKELSGMLALPMSDAAFPGVIVGAARQLPPPAMTRGHGTILADSNYPGMHQPLAISRRDRTMHLWLGGPTGVGKSSLMANIILQDMQVGDGLAVIDPKGDLVRDLLQRIPQERDADVLLVDTADIGHPVGFNILNVGAGVEPELAVDHVVHVLREQWPAYWGPRTDMVLRMALLALTHAKAANGRAFTLCEVPELLTNARLRRWVGEQAELPETVRNSLRWFDGLSEAERGQVIGPALNKLTVFTNRTPLRLMLGQSDGIDLAVAIHERRIILVPLSRGLLGAETVSLISSLLVAALWQTVLGRVALAPEQRPPWWLFIDEAQQVVRLPLEIADLLAEARGLHVGITLGNQHLSQMPESVRRAVLSTVRSQVVFAVEPDDARVLARAFAPSLGEADLRQLGTYEVAMRLSNGGHTGRPVTGRTRPLPPVISDGQDLRRRSRERYGVERGLVERGLRERREAGSPNGRQSFGQRRMPSGESSS